MITPGGLGIISTIDLYSSSSNRNEHRLGQLVQTADGRKFRWAYAVALTVTGDVYSSAAQDAQFESMACATATAIGGNVIYTTNGTTTVAANDFDEGYLMISASTGIGQSSQIVSHTTGASGAAINYTIADPLAVATVAAASTITVVKNPFDDIVIEATTPVAPAVGISQFAIPAAKSGWLQSGGPAAALFDAGTNTTVDLLSISPSSTTAGSVQASTSSVTQVIGFSMQVVSVDSKVGPVFLTID